MTSVSALLLAYLLGKLIIGHIREERKPDKMRLRVMLTLLAEIVIVILCSLLNAPMIEMAFFLSFSMIGFYFATLSFVPRAFSIKSFDIMLALEGLYVILRIASLYTDVSAPPPMLFLYGIMSLPVVISIGYAVFLTIRVADIKNVMRIGSVWNSVCIIVDIIYMSALIFYSWLFAVSVLHLGSASVSLTIIFSVMMISIQMSMLRRLETSSLFVIWTRHERRIVESMKLTTVDMNVESPGVDALYKNIYDRVLEYFERSRPYLNPDLTINDIVNTLYTNKVYISKAICAYTGRNFCQFVNYYRISYAVELFRSNPNMKIVDISTRAGFNSSVSFTMAFRLFMAEKPSEWFRRERAILQKQKGRSSR